MLASGPILRRLRTDKQLTLPAVARETGLTASFISRFERGQNDMTLTNFSKLLAAINVTAPEFLWHLQQNQTSTTRRLTPGKLQNDPILLAFIDDQDLLHLVDQQNYQEKLAPLVAKKRALYRQQPTQKNHHLWLFVQCLYDIQRLENDPQKVTLLTRECQPISHYLQQVDNWGVYEISLFKVFSLVLPTALNLRLLKIGLKKCRTLSDNPTFSDLPASLLLTDFSVFASYHEVAAASDVLKLYQQNINENADHALTARFLAGWLQLAGGKQQAGQQACERVLQLWQELGLNATATAWHHFLDSILENNSMIILSLG